MKKNIIIIILILVSLAIMAGIAWAMTPIPACFFTAPNVCAAVTLTNPLPTGSN